MSGYTKLGSGLWTWKPWLDLEHSHDDLVGRATRLFWIALYTGREAKQVPGLFVGSITTMAETSHVPVDEARTYLDRLLEHELVQVDLRARVLRLTMLPDPGESPSNGKAIRGWWNRFQTIPSCAVRDAHTEVLHWIMAEWSRQNGKALSADHLSAWNDTFGRLPLLTFQRKRPSHIQTSLFDASGQGINNLDSISDTQSIPNRLEQDQDPDKDQDPDLRSPEGGVRSPVVGRPPVLTLVPHPAFDADDLCQTLHTATGGKFPLSVPRNERVALGRAIDVIGDVSMHPSALAFLSEYVASLTGLRAATGGDCGISLELVASPGWIAMAIKRGMDWKTTPVAEGETKGPTE